ncbi:unnamed protein product, partial [Tetraodon nigroviridis]
VDKATNPLNKETDWDNIKSFCDQLNDEPDGPQLATRLLAHKIQSPQEWEALQALTVSPRPSPRQRRSCFQKRTEVKRKKNRSKVLEACVKNGGKRFCGEVGKFRFLNELIKVVSPKYLGSRAPEPVKKKVLEMLYLWTVKLPEETKIADAYCMLKKQGIVLQDPVLPNESPPPPPPPKASSAIFEDEEKSKTLSRLLNSTNPDDLRAANKLIKEMVQEDQKRVEKVSKRTNAILEVKESVALLSQLLQGYSTDSCSQSHRELIKDLYQRCEKMRPTLFRLAGDTEDNDEALADILQANDSLTQVINLYRQLVKGEEVSADEATAQQPSTCMCVCVCVCVILQVCSEDANRYALFVPGSALVDLMGLGAPPSTAPPNPESSSLQLLAQNAGSSLLDDELASLGLNVAENCVSQDMFQSVPPIVLLPAKGQAPSGPPVGVAPAPPKPMEELDLLGKTMLQQALPPESQQVKWDKLQPHSRVTLRDLQKSNAKPALPPASSRADQSGTPDILLSSLSLSAADPYDSISLADVSVPLESIKPSSLLPVTVFDKHSLRVLFTFARDCPPSRPDVLVVIISMLSSAPTPVTHIRFQAAVPKVMRVKLLPPSSSELPAFNPIRSPAAVTQILLLANPHKEKVRLRYKLTFNLGDKAHDESGDVDQFPPPNTWGKL